MCKNISTAEITPTGGCLPTLDCVGALMQVDLVWQRAKQMQELKAVLPVHVESQQRAGYLCKFEDLPSLIGFLPLTHAPQVCGLTALEI